MAEQPDHRRRHPNGNGRSPGKYLEGLLDLKKGLDMEGTVYKIRYNKSMEGANAWMLMCSIMIASLGLDLGSPAVIIGAMLISPLMSPILGVGLAVGTNDLETLQISLRDFGMAILIALITSTLYFVLTPLGTATPEILSRTEPTLLDVLIAFFGGVAGIISISRKDASNAIPGVAIATALMPPLCVTGYGIAHGNMEFALKAFYLFFLNSFFVALATYLIVRYLKFPFLKHLDSKSTRNKALLMGGFSIVMLVPSVVLLVSVYQKTKLQNDVSHFIEEYFQENEKYIDDWELVQGKEFNQLIIKVYGPDLVDSMQDCEDALQAFGVKKTRVEILPTAELDLDEMQALQAEIEGFEKIADQLKETRKVKNEQQLLIDSLSSILISERDTTRFVSTARELKALFPELREVTFGKGKISDLSTYRGERYFLVLDWEPRTTRAARSGNSAKIKAFVEERFQIDSIELITR